MLRSPEHTTPSSVTQSRLSSSSLPSCSSMMRVTRWRTRYVPPFHLALAYTGLYEIDNAFDALEQAWVDRDPALATLDAEPRFEPLRGDPRYRPLVERLRIPRSRVGV